MGARERRIAERRGPKPQHKVAMTAPEYRELQRLTRRRTAPYAEVVRAKILLMAYEHPDWSNAAIARAVGCTDRTVRKWAGAQPGGAGPAGRAPPRWTTFFCPSAVRAQVTALACTLPRDSGKPLSRWSASDLARAVVQRSIVRRISGATVQRWLKADRIKPWQYHSWQRPTDPRFLEGAIPILTLYEQAQALARKGHLVCVAEKTSIQARRACGRTTPARPGWPMHLPDRYQRQGAVQLFGGLLVHTGETLARCFERKRFVEFQSFLGCSSGASGAGGSVAST